MKVLRYSRLIHFCRKNQSIKIDSTKIRHYEFFITQGKIRAVGGNHIRYMVKYFFCTMPFSFVSVVSNLIFKKVDYRLNTTFLYELYQIFRQSYILSINKLLSKVNFELF